MRQNNAIALMSCIREKANRFIVRELASHGIEGIVPSHGEIMVRLFAGKDYTMKELAEEIHRTKPTVTVLVDKLVHYGYVTKEKSLEDSRVTFIKLTERGAALKPVFQEISHKLNNLVYKDLAEQEAIIFEKMLITVNLSIGE
jgi:DNA-binding MarR family transcriptional regulator